MRKNSQKFWSLTRWRDAKAASLSITHATWVIVAVAVSALTVAAVAVPSSPVHQWISCNIGQISLISSKTALPNACQVSAASGGAASAPILQNGSSTIAFDPPVPFGLSLATPTGATITNPTGSAGSITLASGASAPTLSLTAGTVTTATTSTSATVSDYLNETGTNATVSGSVADSAILSGQGDVLAGTTSGAALLFGPSEAITGTVSGPLVILNATNDRIAASANVSSATIVLAGDGDTMAVGTSAPVIVAGNDVVIGSASAPVNLTGGLVVIGQNDQIYANVSGNINGYAVIAAGQANTVSGSISGSVLSGPSALTPGSAMATPLSAGSLEQDFVIPGGSVTVTLPPASGSMPTFTVPAFYAQTHGDTPTTFDSAVAPVEWTGSQWTTLPLVSTTGSDQAGVNPTSAGQYLATTTENGTVVRWTGAAWQSAGLSTPAVGLAMYQSGGLVAVVENSSGGQLTWEPTVGGAWSPPVGSGTDGILAVSPTGTVAVVNTSTYTSLDLWSPTGTVISSATAPPSVAGAAFLSEYSEAGISGLISDGAVGFSAGGTLEFAADRGTHLWQWSGSAWSAVAVPGTIQSSVFGPGGQFAAVLTNGTIAMRSGSGSGWTIIPAGPSEAAYTYLADGTLTYTVQDGQADAVYAWSGTAWTLVAPAPSGTAVALFSQ